MSAATCPNLDAINVMAFLAPKATARLLNTGEKIPADLDQDWEMVKLDPDWVWVVESGGQVRGLLVAANFHGTAFILRLKVLPEVGNMGVVRLLRRFKSDCKNRGVSHFLTLADLTTATGRQLKRIVVRCGGMDAGMYNLMCGPLGRRDW
jgi:hypothetical protein